MATLITVTTTKESTLLIGRLSPYRFTNLLGEEVEHEVFQHCEKVFPQRDPRLLVQKEQNRDGTTTWTIEVPSDYPLTIFHQAGYFEQFEGRVPEVLWRPQQTELGPVCSHHDSTSGSTGLGERKFEEQCL